MDIQLTNKEVLTWCGISQEVYNAVATGESDEFVLNKNKFLSAMINKIAMTKIDRAYFINPFKKFDREDIQYGDTIENIFTEIPMGYDYDIDTAGQNLLAPAKPKVKTLYATLNYEKQYKITIYDTQLRKAVRNEYGLLKLVDYIISNLALASDLDEYFAQIALFSSNANLYANGFESVSTTTENLAKDVTQKIIDVYSNMKFPNTKNNKLKVINPSTDMDLILIIKQDLYNKINLDFLAGVFNLQKVDLIKRIQTIESFVVPVYNASSQQVEQKGEDLDLIIIDTRGIDNHVALSSSGLFYNPEGLFTNHYKNLWKVYGYKTWFNARAFKFTTQA